MNSLVIRYEMPQKKAKIIQKAIQIEVGSVKHDRSKVSIGYEDALVIRIEAKDLHAMRACVNTYLRWIDMSNTLTSQ